MSTKYQWLSHRHFADAPSISPQPSFQTGVAKRLSFSLKQRAVIPVGWHIFTETKKLTTGALVLPFTSYFLCWPPPTYAAVQITEIFAAPTNNNPEWVEIYNSGPDIQSVDGWYLEDRLSSSSIIGNLAGTALQPGQYFQVTLSSNKLNNSGDSVVLYDDNGQQIDSVSYSSTQTDKSWSRIQTQDNFEWQLTNPTPNSPPKPQITISPQQCNQPSPSPTTQPSPSPTPSSSPSPSSEVAQAYDIYISAVMACPTVSSPEYIEVFNTTDKQLSTEGWYLVDAAGNKRFLLTDSQPTSLPPQSFTQISFASSFINNSGETLFLYEASDQLSQTIELPHCEINGTAFTQSGSDWVQASLNSEDKKESKTSNSATSQQSQQNVSEIIPQNQASSSSILGTTTFNSNLSSLQLDVPESATKLFKEPISLLRDDIQHTSPQGLVSVICGGLVICLSTGYKLVKNLAIL